MTPYLCPAEEVDAVWPLVKQWVAGACHRTGDIENADTLREKCKGRRHNLTLLYDDDNRLIGCVIFEHCGEYLHITSCGGEDILENIACWVDFWHQIARAVGCNGLSLKGRRGWLRVLGKFGFTMKPTGFLEAPSWA